MSSMEVINKSVDEIHSNFNELKKTLVQQKEQKADKEYVDAELKAKAERINEAITKAEDALEAAEEAQKMAKAMHEVEKSVQATKDEPAHKAFKSWIRYGEDISAEEKKTLSLGVNTKEFNTYITKELSTFTGPEGGYAVVPEFDKNIIRTIRLTSPMRQYAEVMTIGTSELVAPYEDGDFESGWIGELDERPETDTGTLKMRKWRVFEQYAMPAITQILLEDAFFDVESYVTAALSNRFARVENTAFMVGDGVNQPMGILSYPDGDGTWETIEQVPMSLGGSAGDITYAGLLNLIFALPDYYQQGAVLMMNRKTVQQVRLITDGFDNPIWSPGFGGTPNTLMDFPVVRMPDIPAGIDNSGAGVSGALAMIFGNFREGYRILDRVGLSMLRDPYTRKGFIRLYTRKRVGGDVKNFQAIKVGVLSTS